MMSGRVDLSLFLLPIDKASSCGENIRYDPIYRQLQELRNKEKNAQEPNYQRVEEVCENILKHTSKDLHVAAILSEAWAHLYGLKGLADGLGLVTQLSEAFGNQVHPNKPNDAEARLSIFVWMNDKLSDVVLKTLVTRPKIPGMTAYTLANLIDARQLELTIQKAGTNKTTIIDQAKTENRPTLDDISKSMLVTPCDFYGQLLKDIEEAVLAIERLEAYLEQQFKGDAITLKNFDHYLVQIETFAEQALEQNQLKITHSTVVVDEAEEHNVNDIDTLSTEQLYELLEKIANRLDILEPKSISSKLIRKAVVWGQLSTAELLDELDKRNINVSEITKVLN